MGASPMHTLLQSLLPGPVVTDGAWGTQLQVAGLTTGECPDTWNLSHPDQVERVAQAYVDAGSQIILTNTLGANRLQLKSHGLSDQVAEINRAGAEISRRAAGQQSRVFASVGPTGKLLAMGETNEAQLRDVYDEQTRALAEAGVDALLLETFTDLGELLPAVASAKATGLPVVASMVFDSGAQQDRTMMGTTPEQAAAQLIEAGADVVGANCGTITPREMESIIEGMAPASDRPLIAKPNAGRPRLEAGRTIHDGRPEDLAASVERFVSLGVRMIGGCCGTSPDFIRAAAEALGR